MTPPFDQRIVSDSRLAICIPTYKRAALLAQCLESILISATGKLNEVEINVADDASPDETGTVIQRWCKVFPHFKSVTHRSNLGAEKNKRYVAGMAMAPYIWIFGDDDKVTTDAIARIIAALDKLPDMVVVDNAVYSLNFDKLVHPGIFNWSADGHIAERNAVMRRCGPLLSFQASVVIRKELFFRLPEDTYEQYAPYGFNHMYAFYYGLPACCHVLYLQNPLILQRGGNSEYIDQQKFFIEGMAVIFNALAENGYDRSACRLARDQAICRYHIRILVACKRGDKPLVKLYSNLWKYYRDCPSFWIRLLPLILLPRFLVNWLWRIKQWGMGIIRHNASAPCAPSHGASS